MKYLTIAIPCYNSSEYMARAVLSAAEAVSHSEIIIVDDGSQDDTYSKALELKKRDPDVIRIIHKENGGHGDAVMSALKAAEGLYFLVLDSDDWLDAESLKKLETVIGKTLEASADLLIANYVYEKPSAGKTKPIRYRGTLPPNGVFTWNDIKSFGLGKYLSMHSTIYRRDVLISSGLDLPKHTFYVDNLFTYIPLTHVNTMIYLDSDLYRYYIGRDDQSVNENVLVKRQDEHIKVTKLLIQSHDISLVENANLRKYMLSFVEIMMLISSIILLLDAGSEAIKKRDELWGFLKNDQPLVYAKLCRSLPEILVRGKSAFTRKLALSIYRMIKKQVQFN